MNSEVKHQLLPWQSAWITGAGRGIGAALAEAMCKRGVTVYASSRSEEQLHALKDKVKDFSGALIPAPLDVTNRSEINLLIRSWKERNCFPSLAVLNAGTHDPFDAQVFCADRCRRLLENNLFGTLNCLHPVLECYLSQGCGQIAVMASSAGYRGLPTAAAYGASKAALINLTEALYLDLKNSGVKLQLINPGFVRTPLTDKNDFKMPALMEASDAAKAILSGLQSNQFEICFPKRFVYFLKMLRLLPYRYYFKLTSMIKTPEQGQTSS